MRRISRAAWLAVGGAVLASVLCAVAMARLSRLPLLASGIEAAHETRLLTVASPEGLVILSPPAAYPTRPNLSVAPIRWGASGRLVAIRSVAWSRGRLAVIASVEKEQSTRDSLLILEDRSLATVATSPGALFGLHSASDHFELWAHIDGGFEPLSVTRQEKVWRAAAGERRPVGAPLSAID